MIRLDSDHFRPICFILIILHGKERTRCGEDTVWIFDSYSKGSVELWGREKGLTKVSAACPPSFYIYLDDPSAHVEMIEGLESRYKIEDCSFRTIYGTFQGYRIFASRKVAEKIEKQTRYEAQLYNVDVRQDQRYMAEHDIFPCMNLDDSGA